MLKMQTDRDLEAKIIQLFVRKDKRERYLVFINKTKTRDKFISELAHFRDLDFDNFEKISGDERQFIKTRISTLANISDCYAISENRKIDGQRIDIKTALDETIGSGMGTILVFGDGDTVYFEGEEMNERWLSL